MWLPTRRRTRCPTPSASMPRGAVFETYQGFGLPTHVFIDADGVIRHLRYGPLDREQAAEIDRAAARAPPS